MHIISHKRILEFAKEHPTSRNALEGWYQIMRNIQFEHFNHLKTVFPSADQVKGFTVFNIAGNRYRLISALHYNRKKCYIRHILTHAEYDKGRWKI